jgi:hypothetical protein
MADPFRFSYRWPGGPPSARGGVESALILRQDAVRRAAYLISKHELSLWFEPRWEHARILARRFPHCTICSIPTESDTPNLHRVPGWRPRRQGGTL